MRNSIFRGAMLAVGCAAAVPAYGGWLTGPSNIEECVLEKLKGQNTPSAVYATARRACEREFPVEIDRGTATLSWSSVSSSETVVSIERNLSDFAVTKAVSDFSVTPCDKAKDENFNIRGVAEFTSWIPGYPPKTSATMTFSQPFDQETLQCMRTISVFGKRIK